MPQDILRQLFLDARTHNGWKPGDIDEATLQKLYELTRMPPTAANCQPGRFVFVKSAAAKARLKPALSAGNVEKTMAAPATAICAYDLRFADRMSKLFPVAPSIFDGLDGEALISTLTQNGSLQCAYLILAARALGLDCGPMGGFDRAKVDAAFFEGTSWRSILLVNLGSGDESKLYPRNPRLSFDEACRIV